MDIPLDELHHFIVCAKAATYIGDGEPSLPRRPGAHDLEFTEPPFAYLDSYFGGADFLGQEVVYYKEHPVWAMNYYGRLIEPAMISAAEVGQVLKESLSLLYEEGRFLGSFEHKAKSGTYFDTSEGDVSSFTGREWIECEGIIVYELVYHGGIIR